MKKFVFIVIVLFLLFVGIPIFSVYFVFSSKKGNNEYVEWKNIPVCPMLNQPSRKPLDKYCIIRYCENCKRDFDYLSETHMWISKDWLSQK